MSIVTDAIGGILSPVKDIIGEVVVDPNKRDQINLQLQQLADQADQRLSAELVAQINVNNTEASNKSLFVAGWRPFIGWVGGAGVAWSFVVGPLASYVAHLCGSAAQLPTLDSTQLMTLVLAMLGIGGMRTYEKLNGVASDTMTINKAAPAKDPDSQSILDQLHASAAQALPEKAPWA